MSSPRSTNITERSPSEAAAYVSDTFHPDDRLAVVAVSKQTRHVIQRITTAQHLTTQRFMDWLQERNRAKYEIYVSMNALKPDAAGRTKTDIATIRHLYLDFDYGGRGAVERALTSGLPEPTYVLGTSPEKFQVVWRVEGFRLGQAEALQRALARKHGADIAATDASRVLRLPGFDNHKYGSPFRVTIESATPSTYRPVDFPRPETLRVERSEPTEERVGRSRGTPAVRPLSQSERDWSYAKRALSRGDSPASVIAAIAQHRQYDKPNPYYYAELTVTKAAQSLAQTPDISRTPARTGDADAIGREPSPASNDGPQR